MYNYHLPLTVTELQSSDRRRAPEDLHKMCVCLGCVSTKYMQSAYLEFNSDMRVAVLDR